MVLRLTVLIDTSIPRLWVKDEDGTAGPGNRLPLLLAPVTTRTLHHLQL
jgi:hypothetical protein